MAWKEEAETGNGLPVTSGGVVTLDGGRQATRGGGNKTDEVWTTTPSVRVRGR